MADQGSDRSLLDRLNALKPTSVSLDAPQNILDSTTRGQPVSREDALAARLRILRKQSGGGQEASIASAASPPGIASPPKPPRRASGTSGAPGAPDDSGEVGIQDDPLSLADEDALNDFLEDLGAEDAEWFHAPAAAAASDKSEDDEARVASLLESLGKDIAKPTTPEPDGEEDEEERVAALLRRLGKQDQGPPHDDDSDAGDMRREVDEVLAQARDEAELEAHHAQSDGEDGRDRAGAPEQKKPGPSGDSRREDQDAPAHAAAADPFALPTVPSALVDFEDAIASRMAALKGVSGAAVVRTDDWGLPSAPTFQPEDHKPASPRKAKAGRSAGFTDADRKTWCIVCLEDAAVRCLGCDDGDAYCWRCWREMHVGPAAGFDERGHKWVKFEREDG